MSGLSAEAKLELMKHVERAVRPVCAPWMQKMQMRTNLVTHLTALFEEEFVRHGDARAAVAQAIEQVGSPAELSAKLQYSVPRHTYWKCKLGQAFFGLPQESAFLRAARAAAFVALLLVVGIATHPLLVLAGLVPEYFPFSWSGAMEEMMVKPALAFVLALFLHGMRRLVQDRRRGLALGLVAATGPALFLAGLISFGPTHVFSTSALTDEAIIAWVGPILVPGILFAVVTGLEPMWLQIGEWNDLSLD
jgi:hypothetical protein